ncbi:MAG: ABC transporter ATP-binding protein [Oscillospiraceae bacterium]|nr:ABC transporter ATP-binding protein [Oscillospiraceae bacterium]
MSEAPKNNVPRRGPMGPGGQMVGEKPKDFKSAFGRFVSYCKPYATPIIIAFVLSIAGAIFTIIGPDRLREITNLIIEGTKASAMSAGATGIDLEKIGSIALTLAILYGIGALCSYGQGFIMSTVTQRLTNSMRKQLSGKINRLPLKYFDNESFGNVLSRITNDVDTIGQTLNMSVGQLTSAIALFFGSLIMMFATNVIMTLTAIGSTIIGFALMMFIMGKSQKYFKNQQRELGRINGHIEETYSSLSVVRAYNGEAQSSKTFTGINDKLYQSAWKAQFISGIMMPMMGFIGNFGYVAVCVVGAALAMSGKIEFGVIVAFMVYIRLFTQPLAQAAQSLTTLQSTAAAAERVFQFLDEEELPPEVEGVITTHEAKGEVEFKDVKFSYNPDREIIKDFSAHAMPGQKIAIVGPTGSGKTTIVNLLMRFYELKGGEILIDGIPISQMTRECVHDQFCMVLQDTWLFEGTIRDNIIYSKENVPDEEVIKACKAVGLHHFIRTLPDGYNTVLGDTASLSAGQRQLLTIARAIIENAPLLILDEATSSVDTRTEVQIQRAMDKLTEGRTSFIIAHRLSTIKSADLILVMRDGCIVERGTHEELLSQGGFYAELYNSQFDDEIA